MTVFLLRFHVSWLSPANQKVQRKRPVWVYESSCIGRLCHSREALYVLPSSWYNQCRSFHRCREVCIHRTALTLIPQSSRRRIVGKHASVQGSVHVGSWVDFLNFSLVNVYNVDFLYASVSNFFLRDRRVLVVRVA